MAARKCSRFQFECHSGECIAIYNACDGIPQCQDNTDEDPALGCPAASTEGAPSVRRLGDGAAGGSGEAVQPPAATWDNVAPAKSDPRSSVDVWQGGSRFPNSGQGYPPGIFSHRPTILDTYSPYQPSVGSQSLIHWSQNVRLYVKVA
nr:low-density lipoprotein receptor-related protein 11-like [Cherax quadricarinatus]